VKLAGIVTHSTLITRDTKCAYVWTLMGTYSKLVDLMHLSIFLALLQDPCDDQLKWPLWGDCEVKLLQL